MGPQQYGNRMAGRCGRQTEAGDRPLSCFSHRDDTGRSVSQEFILSLFMRPPFSCVLCMCVVGCVRPPLPRLVSSYLCFWEQDPARTKEAELVLMSRLSDTKKDVKHCLCDDFDTPGAVGALQELVKAVNKVGFGARAFVLGLPSGFCALSRVFW